MKILLAGATSTLGQATLHELVRRNHDVVPMTRSAESAARLRARGLEPVVADVLDQPSVAAAVAECRPDAVVSLLIKLPRNGPTRYRDYRESRRLWDVGVPNLLAAAQAAGTTRIVGESVVFAYGYCDHGVTPLSEDATLVPGATAAQREVLDSLRGMEEAIRGAGGVVLRYGLFRGSDVPSEGYLAKLMRMRLPMLPGGGQAVHSFVDLRDAARATADAVERGTPGSTYNICDDRPAEFATYARVVAEERELPAPRSAPLALSRLAMPYTAFILSQVRIPMSNERARQDLGWRPSAPPLG